VTPVDDTGAAVYGSIEACGTDINQLDAVTLSSGNYYYSVRYFK